MPAAQSISMIYDQRLDCYSAMAVLSVEDYFALVEHAYPNRGGIEGQRDRLRTTSAVRIRRRMIDDIVQGTVLPPVTLGIVVSRSAFSDIESLPKRELGKWIRSLDPARVTIIDGMQRTTALFEATQRDIDVLSMSMRVELWITKRTNSLIYRMLILNTGQVPWNLRRQVEIVFRSLLAEVQEQVKGLEVLKADQARRRAHGGQFQADDLVELFLAFGSRKEKVNVRERLADEFTRLDFIEAAADSEFSSLFARAIALLTSIDVAFDAFKDEVGTSDRFRHGKDLFSSQPAAIGFITAVALETQGRPGTTRTSEDHAKRMSKLEESCNTLVNSLAKLTPNEVGTFLAFETLNEVIQQAPSGISVGDYEREFFLKSFQVLIEENFDLPEMTACWRAY